MCHRDTGQRAEIFPGRRLKKRDGPGMEQRKVPDGPDPGKITEKAFGLCRKTEDPYWNHFPDQIRA